MKWIVTGVIAGLLAGCSSPTEPEVVGLFAHGTVTCREEINFEKVVIRFTCQECSDQIVYIHPTADGTYAIKVTSPDAHFGHIVFASANYQEYGPPQFFEDRKDWDSFPSTPVEWNPELK